MMRYLVIISSICLVIGAFCFAISREWCIFRWPTNQLISPIIQHTTKKKVTMFFWRNQAWHQETSEILWSDSKTQNITHLLHTWLKVIDEEGVGKQHLSLQSVMLTQREEFAYLSFDQNPIIQQDSTMTTLLWFEAILKTLSENEISLQGVYFMQHHQPLQDFHLDFSHPWPLCGFIKR